MTHSMEADAGSKKVIITDVHDEQCLNARHFDSKCHYCIDTCSSKALTLKGSRIELDTDKCTSCGICLSICPSEAFTSKLWTEESLIRSAKRHGKEDITLFCKHVPIEIIAQNHAFRTSVCLGALSPAVLFELAKGFNVCLKCACSDKCGERIGFEIVCKNAAVSNSWLKANGAHHEVVAIQLEPESGDTMSRNIAAAAQEELTSTTTTKTVLRRKSKKQNKVSNISSEEKSPIDRRDYLMGFIGEGSPLYSILVNDKSKSVDKILKNTLPKQATHHIPSSIKRLQANWRNQPEPKEAAFFPSVKFDVDQCVGCGACEQFCLTGALVSCLEENQFKMKFTPGLCADCGLCTCACTTGSLKKSYRKEKEPFSKREVFSSGEHPCLLCGASVIKDDDVHCYWCTNNKNDKELIESAKKAALWK